MNTKYSSSLEAKLNDGAHEELNVSSVNLGSNKATVILHGGKETSRPY
ncbi:Uncharacterised protein [Legionella quinlivanii]|nr:hypothetical protein [Legionella quinlivanii]STY09996.1 Uncharacterised protein [Legionella quinlivanii]